MAVDVIVVKGLETTMVPPVALTAVAVAVPDAYTPKLATPKEPTATFCSVATKLNSTASMSVLTTPPVPVPSPP